MADAERIVPKTDPNRSAGGADSGVPPSFKVATGLHDHGQPHTSASRQNAFGIDFGEDHTRIAGLVNGVPRLYIIRRSAEELRSGAIASRLRSSIRSESTTQADNGEIDVSKLTSLFFTRITNELKDYGGIPRPKAVLVLPAYYCSHERVQLVEILQEGGLEILGVLNDYAALVHSFVQGRANRQGNMLAISWGAESFTSAVVSVHNDIIETKAVRSQARLGSRPTIGAIANQLLYECDTTTQSITDLSVEDEGAWLDFTMETLDKPLTAKQISIEFRNTNKESIVLAQQQLRDMIARSIESQVAVITDVLKHGLKSGDELSFVLLCGQIFKSAYVSRVLTRSLPNIRVMVLNAQKATAFGAAVRAGVLSHTLEEPRIWDVLTQPVFVLEDDHQRLLVSLDTSLPATFRARLTGDICQFKSSANESSDFCVLYERASLGEIQDSVDLSLNSNGIVEQTPASMAE